MSRLRHFLVLYLAKQTLEENMARAGGQWAGGRVIWWENKKGEFLCRLFGRILPERFDTELKLMQFLRKKEEREMDDIEIQRKQTKWEKRKGLAPNCSWL